MNETTERHDQIVAAYREIGEVVRRAGAAFADGMARANAAWAEARKRGA